MIPYGKRLIELRGEKARKKQRRILELLRLHLECMKQSGEFPEILLKSQ